MWWQHRARGPLIWKPTRASRTWRAKCGEEIFRTKVAEKVKYTFYLLHDVSFFEVLKRKGISVLFRLTREPFDWFDEVCVRLPRMFHAFSNWTLDALTRQRRRGYIVQLTGLDSCVTWQAELPATGVLLFWGCRWPFRGQWLLHVQSALTLRTLSFCLHSIINSYDSQSRSQWPRGLRHELSSPARTLGSWVGIPLKTWMSVCVYSVFVLSCVGRGLAACWSPVQGILPTVLVLRNWSETKRFTDSVCSRVVAIGEREIEMILRINSDYFPKESALCNEDEVRCLWGFVFPQFRMKAVKGGNLWWFNSS
jgi:hypothetical protein